MKFSSLLSEVLTAFDLGRMEGILKPLLRKVRIFPLLSLTGIDQCGWSHTPLDAHRWALISSPTIIFLLSI